MGPTSQHAPPPPDLHEQATALRASRQPIPFATHLPSAHARCPLCDLGEASAEHLLMWCPAPALAWQRYSRSTQSLISQVLDPPEDPTAVTSLLHQTLYLYTSVLGRTQLTPAKADTHILRALVCSRFPEHELEDQDDPDHTDFGAEAAANEIATWGGDPPPAPPAAPDSYSTRKSAPRPPPLAPALVRGEEASSPSARSPVALSQLIPRLPPSTRSPPRLLG